MWMMQMDDSKGIKVTDDEMKKINHGEWNYTITPKNNFALFIVSNVLSFSRGLIEVPAQENSYPDYPRIPM